MVDKNAFLFSVSKKTKHSIIKEPMHPLHMFSTYSVTFGYDLSIRDNCNGRNDSQVYIGLSFTPPEGIVKRTPEAERYLAGASNFYVTEIEIFSVKF